MALAQVPRRSIAFTVIGGFLGAGKTTAINALLASVADRRIAVLVNDFGDLAIDAALVTRRNATTIGLANGCVCCSLAGGLVQAIIDAMALEPAPDAIVIEASGVSDPRRIAQIARTDPALAPDATIVLVAADQWRPLSCDRYVGDLVQAQVAAADVLVLNKVDLVSAAERDALRAQLRAFAPRASQFETTGAQLPYAELLGHTLDAALRSDMAPLGAALGAHDRRPPMTGTLPVAAPRADHDVHARQFATRTLRSPFPVSAALLRHALECLPPSVLRAKGFVRLDEAPDTWQLVQVVGSRWSLAATTAPGGQHLDSALVVMGPAATLVDADLAPLAAAFAAMPSSASARLPSRPAPAARGR